MKAKPTRFRTTYWFDDETIRLLKRVMLKHGHRWQTHALQYCIRQTAVAEGLVKEKKL